MRDKRTSNSILNEINIEGEHCGHVVKRKFTYFGQMNRNKKYKSNKKHSLVLSVIPGHRAISPYRPLDAST